MRLANIHTLCVNEGLSNATLGYCLRHRLFGIDHVVGR